MVAPADKFGRKYALLSRLEAGAELIADGGFACIAPQSECMVEADDKGELFVRCRHGRHYLTPAVTAGELVGFYHAGESA